MPLAARQLLIGTLIIDFALVGVGYLSGIFGESSYILRARFGLNLEATVTAWYSSAKLLAVAALLGVLSVALGTEHRPRYVLLVAACAFLLMSLDETAAFHEAAASYVRFNIMPAEYVALGDRSGVPFSAIVVGLAGLIIVGVVVRAAVLALRDCRTGGTQFMLGFAVFIAGAVLIDLAHESSGLPDLLAYAVEEGLELIGSSIMLYGAARALGAHPTWNIDHTGIGFKVNSSPAPARNDAATRPQLAVVGLTGEAADRALRPAGDAGAPNAR